MNKSMDSEYDRNSNEGQNDCFKSHENAIVKKTNIPNRIKNNSGGSESESEILKNIKDNEKDKLNKVFLSISVFENSFQNGLKIIKSNTPFDTLDMNRVNAELYGLYFEVYYSFSFPDQSEFIEYYFENESIGFLGEDTQTEIINLLACAVIQKNLILQNFCDSNNIISYDFQFYEDLLVHPGIEELLVFEIIYNESSIFMKQINYKNSIESSVMDEKEKNIKILKKDDQPSKKNEKDDENLLQDSTDSKMVVIDPATESFLQKIIDNSSIANDNSNYLNSYGSFEKIRSVDYNFDSSTDSLFLTLNRHQNTIYIPNDQRNENRHPQSPDSNPNPILESIRINSDSSLFNCQEKLNDDLTKSELNSESNEVLFPDEISNLLKDHNTNHIENLMNNLELGPQKENSKSKTDSFIIEEDSIDINLSFYNNLEDIDSKNALEQLEKELKSQENFNELQSETLNNLVDIKNSNNQKIITKNDPKLNENQTENEKSNILDLNQILIIKEKEQDLNNNSTDSIKKESNSSYHSALEYNSNANITSNQPEQNILKIAKENNLGEVPSMNSLNTSLDFNKRCQTPEPSLLSKTFQESVNNNENPKNENEEQLKYSPKADGDNALILNKNENSILDKKENTECYSTESDNSIKNKLIDSSEKIIEKRAEPTIDDFDTEDSKIDEKIVKKLFIRDENVEKTDNSSTLGFSKFISFDETSNISSAYNNELGFIKTFLYDTLPALPNEETSSEFERRQISESLRGIDCEASCDSFSENSYNSNTNGYFRHLYAVSGSKIIKSIDSSISENFDENEYQTADKKDKGDVLIIKIKFKDNKNSIKIKNKTKNTIISKDNISKEKEEISKDFTEFEQIQEKSSEKEIKKKRKIKTLENYHFTVKKKEHENKPKIQVESIHETETENENENEDENGNADENIIKDENEKVTENVSKDKKNPIINNEDEAEIIKDSEEEKNSGQEKETTFDDESPEGFKDDTEKTSESVKENMNFKDLIKFYESLSKKE